MKMTENEMRLSAAARREREMARRYTGDGSLPHRARTDAEILEIHRARMDWLHSRAETNERG